MNKEVMKQVLEVLKNNRRKHYGCEDTWYSCPKHEDGCYDEHAGSECNCGADEANVEIDAAIKILQKTQDEPDDLMTAYMSGLYDGKKQRTWVGLSDEDIENEWRRLEAIYIEEIDPAGYCWQWYFEFTRAIESRLKEKNT